QHLRRLLADLPGEGINIALARRRQGAKYRGLVSGLLHKDAIQKNRMKMQIAVDRRAHSVDCRNCGGNRLADIVEPELTLCDAALPAEYRVHHDVDDRGAKLGVI